MAHSKEGLGARAAFFKDVLLQVKRTGCEDVRMCRERTSKASTRDPQKLSLAKEPGASLGDGLEEQSQSGLVSIRKAPRDGQDLALGLAP